MTISVVNASSDQTLDQTSDTLVNSMTITPAAGDYLVAFTGFLDAGATAKTYEFSLYVGGAIVQHTERACDIEGSIAAAGVSVGVATHAHVSVNGSQAIEVRYRRTTGTTASIMKRRTLTLFPKASADFQQVTATGDATVSATTDTLLTGMTITPGAGTYLLVFSDSADNSATGIQLFHNVYVGGVLVGHSERAFNAEASISANLGAMPSLIACKVTPTAGQAVEIRCRRVTNNWTVHERTLTLMKVADADIKEATQTADEADTGVADELLVGMTIADPGAADWLAIFGTSQRYGTITANNTATFSLYNAGVRDDNTERAWTQESSIDDSDYYGFTHGKLTVAGATDDVELRWKGSTTTSRTAHERTLVMVKEAAGGAIAGTSTSTFTPTGTMTGAGALAGSCAVTFTPSAVMTGAADIAGSSTVTFTPVADLTGTSDIAGTVTVSFTDTGMMGGAGALAGSGEVAFTNAATLIADGALEGSGTVIFTQAAALSGAGELVGSAVTAFTPTAVMAADGDLAGSALVEFTGTGTLSSTGSEALAGIAALTFTPTATLVGDGVLAGISILDFTDIAVLTGAAPIAGSLTLAFAPLAALSGDGILAGTSTLLFTDSASLAGSGAMVGSSDLAFTDNAALLADGLLAGASTVSFANTGTATGTGALSGISALAFAESATLAGAGALAGSGTLVFTGSGTALGAAPGEMSGFASLSFTPQGVLLADGTLAGESVLALLAAAGITGSAQLSGLSSLAFDNLGTLVDSGATYSLPSSRGAPSAERSTRGVETPSHRPAQTSAGRVETPSHRPAQTSAGRRT
jgi:hypothetical protein